ncbi:Tripartite tricarboxylate transporter substrate binding protein [Bordetella sputigena]
MRVLCRKEVLAFALLSATVPMSVMAGDEDSKQAYPERPVTLVVGYPPGGTPDTLVRVLADYLEREMGQRLIVDYKPGAASNIGAQAVARSVPDGYTVFLSARPNTTHKVMYGNLDYDFARDLVPVGLLATAPYVMVVSADAPIASVGDLVQLARTYPGAMTCASSGIGSTPHLLCELLQQETDTAMLHIPYQGSAQALQDVAGGRVDMQITNVSGTLQQIQAGKLRPIAVMSSTRVSSLPQVPTIAEAGFPSLTSAAWFGLMAPKGTPSYAIEKLNRSVNVAMMNPNLREAMAQLIYDLPPQPNTPTAFEDLIAEETQQWTALLHARNIKPLH